MKNVRSHPPIVTTIENRPLHCSKTMKHLSSKMLVTLFIDDCSGCYTSYSMQEVQCTMHIVTTGVGPYLHVYHSVPGKHPCTCTSFQGVNVAASMQTYIPGKHPCSPKSCIMFKWPCMGAYPGDYGVSSMKYAYNSDPPYFFSIPRPKLLVF